MKLSLNVNLKDAMLLVNTLERIDANFIHYKIHQYEMENMSIENIKMGVKRIIRELNNFNKDFDIFYKDAIQLRDWLGVQGEYDTEELLGISIVTIEDETQVDEADRVLCNLYGDLARAIKQYKLSHNE